MFAFVLVIVLVGVMPKPAAVARESAGRTRPVSYTHLDVYKRQGLALNLLWPKLRGKLAQN